MPKYSTVDLMLSGLPAIGSRTNILSADMHDNFLKPAEAIVDSNLARTYTLPITANCVSGQTCDVPILQTIATDLAIYRLLSLRIFAQEKKNESEWPNKFKQAMDMLEELASGSMDLVDDDGNIISERTDVGSVETSNDGYFPTMSEDDVMNQIDDPDFISDTRADRDIYVP